MSILSLLFFKKDSTILYPLHPVKPILPKRSRGFLSVDTYKCDLCGKCKEACPSNAIDIDDNNISININYIMCMYCHQCISSCPKKALSFSEEFEGASKNKRIFNYKFNIININQVINKKGK
jgi:formate hydrogenlyase subunit 6/NADH:ubiquinone oxidoreductase subunit I